MMQVIKLPSRCDRAAVVALLPEVVAAQSGSQLTVDASEVEQVGQAALQLLASARSSGEGISIIPSTALADAAQLMGLTELLFDGEA